MELRDRFRLTETSNGQPTLEAQTYSPRSTPYVKVQVDHSVFFWNRSLVTPNVAGVYHYKSP